MSVIVYIYIHIYIYINKYVHTFQVTSYTLHVGAIAAAINNKERTAEREGNRHPVN